jgi:hypothetical protein
MKRRGRQGLASIHFSLLRAQYRNRKSQQIALKDLKCWVEIGLMRSDSKIERCHDETKYND